MTDLLAASRYAQALFEIARLMHNDEQIEAELESLSAALKRSPEIQKMFDNPNFSAAQKRAFLEKIYQERNRPFYEILLNFFAVLFEKNRFGLIHDIAVTFKRIADEAQGQGVAQITTAAPLKEGEEARIAATLERLAGYSIRVEKSVDPSLVGGVVVRVRNKIIDGSVKHKIEILKKELTKAGNI